MINMPLFAQWWARVPQGDKRIYLSLGLLITPVLLYTFLWLPLQNARSALDKSLEAKSTQFRQMQVDAKQISQLRAAAQVTHANIVSLEKAIQDSAQIHGVMHYVHNLRHSENQVMLELEAIPFDQWVHWTEALQQEHQISLSTLSLHRTQQPGLIDAKVSFGLQEI